MVMVFAASTQIDTIHHLYIQATSSPANLIIDTQGVISPLNRSWQYIAQGGEEDNYRLYPIQDKLTQLALYHLRLDHIYTFYVDISRGSDGQLIFDWTKLNNIIGDMQASGVTPFISLSYMPTALNPNDLTGLPNNWSDWETVITQTVEHISGRDGLNIPDVYYEVWNEPDLFGQFRTYGQKNYLTLYYHTARAAQRAQNTQPFKIGGPSTTALYRNWVTRFFDFATQHNLPVDFYSWHRYDYNPDRFMRDITEYERIVRNYPQYAFTTERLITEWGPTSEVHPVYDGNLAAAHYAAVITQVNPFINKMYAFELQDGRDPAGSHYWGRWGMLTHQSFGSVPKPRYHANVMFNRLGQSRLSIVGHGTFVRGIAAQKDGQTTQVIVSNYDPRGLHTETVPITFRRLDPGSYTLTQEFINRLPATYTFEVEQDSLTHEIAMPPNSVVLIELTHQDSAPF